MISIRKRGNVYQYCFEVGPRTNPKAYKRASKALKINEDMTLHNEEIDLFLPDNLKRKNKSMFYCIKYRIKKILKNAKIMI